MEELKTEKFGDITFYFGIEQGTQEWLDLRKGRVTCSNAETLLTSGVNKCLQKNEDSANRLTPNGNSYAERGHVVEDEVREALNEQLRPSGFEVKTATFITNDKYPNAGYSPDGLIVKLGDDNWVKNGINGYSPVEIKAYNDVVVRNGKEVKVNKHKKACENFEDVPFGARMQMQMEMMMCEADELVLVLANPDAEEGVPKVHIWRVERDEKIIEKIKEKLSAGIDKKK